MKLFNNPSKVIILIVLFLIAFFTIRTCEADEPTGRVELGAAFTGEFNGGYALVYSERVSRRWDVGVVLVSEQDTTKYGFVENNGGVRAARVVRWGLLEMGLGAAVFIDTDEFFITSNLVYDLSVGLTKDRWSLMWRHWSNAGTSGNNQGQDLLTIGYNF